MGTCTCLSPDIVSFCSSTLTRLHLLQQLLMDKRVGLKRYELNGRKVLFYFDEVSDGGGRGGGSAWTKGRDCFVRNVCISLCRCSLGLFWCRFVHVCHPLLDPQPVYDVCGLQSGQRVHCGQDSTCPGQDLRLLRTRCASDEYLKEWPRRKTLTVISACLPLLCGSGALKT